MFKKLLHKRRAPFWVFYIMIFYIVASYLWWMVLLYTKNMEICRNQEKLLQYRWEIAHKGQMQGLTESDPYAAIIHQRRQQNFMISGEAMVFLVLLGIGIWQVHKAFEKDMQLNRQQKNFLLSVTHELKSPLASTKINLQTLAKRKQLDDDTYNRILKNSHTDIERLQNLVENLLLSARMESSDYAVVRQDFDISALLSGIADRYTTTFGHMYVFHSNIQSDIIIKADKSAVASMVHNLVDNAIKYAPHGTDIDISAHTIDNNLHIRIADKGPGIPPAEKDMIFKKFYRIGNEDTRETKGTGLGLYIVRRMVEAHEGFITVSDNTPTGTIFDIILPLIL